MTKKKIATQLLLSLVLLIGFVGCESDFVTLESDVINSDTINNFAIKDSSYDLITSNMAIGPVQTDRAELSGLGIYNDYYGTTQSSFVTQLNLSNYNPTFGDGVEVDSVVLYMPYFVQGSEIDSDDNLVFEIDSVIGRSPIRLRVYENGYFIRDFDPGGDFSDEQPYFSNKSASEIESIPINLLESEELGFVEYNSETGQFDPIENTIDINENGYILTESDNAGGEDPVISIQPPGIRVLLDPEFWVNKIISKEGDPVLDNPNNFNNYFRGLFFKAEPVNGTGSYLLLNTLNPSANITIFYSRLTEDEDDEDDARENVSFSITMDSNRINFIDNTFNIDLEDGDNENGDARLFLKGGEGSLAKVVLFNGDDIDNNDDELNSFEQWKNSFVETDEDGKFIRSKRLVNEANLVFFVDENLITSNYPERIYVYDMENKLPLVDYFLDIPNNGIPSLSRINHLGPLERVGGKLRYKVKITEHIKNLLLRDSTNVDLGLSVSLNVNSENPSNNPGQRLVQSSSNEFTVPPSSVLSPRGTVLHGNNTESEDRRVYLEIYYTEPNN